MSSAAHLSLTPRANRGAQDVDDVAGVIDQQRPGPGGSAAVQVEGLVKTYQSRTGTVEAVRGVDLIVEAGGVFGFLGPNGAGKSTTVKMLTTLLSITSGTAFVAGIDVAREPD